MSTRNPDFIWHPIFSCLTERERTVMFYVIRGLSSKMIGKILSVSQRTVEAHRAQIFRKMRVRNAVQLVSHIWRSCPRELAVRMCFSCGQDVRSGDAAAVRTRVRRMRRTRES